MNSTNHDITVLADYATVCGENPLWHPLEKRMYWTDIPTGRIFCYDPVSGEHELYWQEQGRQVGGFTVQTDGTLLLFMDRCTIAVMRDGKIEKTVIEHLPDEIHTRFNDVIADPEGRVFCGTMAVSAKGDRPGRLGRLYRLDRDGSIHKLLDGIGCSNGMGFTPDGRHLYYTDSPKREIYLFDYDRASGALSNQRVFVNSLGEAGVPDGMTVDSAGDVWSARWDGHCCTRYSPDGKEQERLHFPDSKKISSVAFGGADLLDMYFTTAGGDKKGDNGTAAGALLRMRATVPGVAEFFSRITL
ncbi:MAG: SMP-30/gluconolactonase/LRE family protein [Phycisphaeraceae bacterium]